MRLTTWFAEAGTLAARRDWMITDAVTGARLGSATSTWLAFNLITRRMARLPPALRSYFQTASPATPRWALGEGFAPERCPELPSDTPCCVSSRTRVRRCDLDMNQHVNNASYIEWILDDVPAPVFDSAFMSGLDIEYRSECKAGDEIDARSALALPDGTCLVQGASSADAGPCTQPLTFQHALLRPSDGAELLRARTLWMPRQQALADGAKLALAAKAAAAAARH